MARLTSYQQRALKRATLAWMADKPHQALDIITAAGMADVWPTFQREQLKAARRRFLARMATARAA
jgi:hypothetical protein